MDLVPYCLPVLADPDAFVKSGAPLRDEENRAIVSDEIQFKANRTIHRYSTQIRGADDRYYGRFYIFEDVTDAKMAEDELIKARNEADDANRAKSEFLSRMSHELRTPLNSILGFAQLLEMGELNAKQQKGVGHILRSGKHLLSLINDVLDISRIESGRISISIEPVQLSPVFDEMIDVLRPISASKNITMRLEASLFNSCFVKADRQSLKQVLLNLLNNAIKYNRPDGMVNICTQLIADELTGVEQIRISLIDTGVGIAAEDIQKIFTPFERIGAEKTGIEGTGLGLAVVKKLVDAMGGKLGVESVPGEGSTFWVQFERAESLLDTASMISVISSDPEGVHTRKSTILYIEDNVSNIELVEQVLHSQRPDIRLVCNMTGKPTVKLAMEYKPDLIMLDLNLPDIHGSRVLTEVMKNPNTKDIPVVVVSADAMSKQIETLMAEGAKAYLTKPLEIKLFLNIVDEFTKE
jgi:signal transduction histidine kinase/CheY-like chemotaxis protein